MTKQMIRFTSDTNSMTGICVYLPENVVFGTTEQRSHGEYRYTTWVANEELVHYIANSVREELLRYGASECLQGLYYKQINEGPKNEHS